LKTKKYNKLKNKIIKHKQKLVTQITDMELDGHSLCLVEILIGVNQFVFENRDLVQAWANDQDRQRINQFKVFADLYLMPTVLSLI